MSLAPLLMWGGRCSSVGSPPHFNASCPHHCSAAALGTLGRGAGSGDELPKNPGATNQLCLITPKPGGVPKGDGTKLRLLLREVPGTLGGVPHTPTFLRDPGVRGHSWVPSTGALGSWHLAPFCVSLARTRGRPGVPETLGVPSARCVRAISGLGNFSPLPANRFRLKPEHR